MWSPVKLAEEYIDAHEGWFIRYNRNYRNTKQIQAGYYPRQSQSSSFRGTKSTVPQSATNMRTGRSNITRYESGYRDIGLVNIDVEIRWMRLLMEYSQIQVSVIMKLQVNVWIKIVKWNMVRFGQYYQPMPNQGQLYSCNRPH